MARRNGSIPAKRKKTHSHTTSSSRSPVVSRSAEEDISEDEESTTTGRKRVRWETLVRGTSKDDAEETEAGEGDPEEACGDSYLFASVLRVYQTNIDLPFGCLLSVTIVAFKSRFL